MNQRHGFTIIELLVVLAISALLSGLAITYSNVGRNAVSLSIEESKIAQFILQAKELSLATYTSASASCAYGFTMDIPDQTYSIFAYSPAGAPPCPPGAGITNISSGDIQQYTEGTWHIAVSNGVKVVASSTDTLATVLFYPPDPTVFLMDQNEETNNLGFEQPPGTMHVYLVTADGKNSATISINAEGQVSF